MSEQNNDGLVPGIYNYCDRWCERCRLSHRCFLYTKEKERAVEHRRKGEDPNDWKIVLEDIEESLSEAMQLIKKAASEKGINLDTSPVEKEQFCEPHNHPLFNAAEEYRKLAHKFLEKLRIEIQAEGVELSERIGLSKMPKAFCLTTRRASPSRLCHPRKRKREISTKQYFVMK